jgi:hypothetical protein
MKLMRRGIALIGLALVAGCGNGSRTCSPGDHQSCDCGNLPPGFQLCRFDGTWEPCACPLQLDMTVVDLRPPPPDLTLPVGRGCGFVYSCLGMGRTVAQCTANSPPEAVQRLRNFVDCVNGTCGLGVDAGTGAACKADMNGLGCTTCENNTLAGPSTFFSDAAGNPLMCMPTTASECGVCLPAARTCIFDDCYSDTDCAGLSSGGAPATCNLTGGVPGTCR